MSGHHGEAYIDAAFLGSHAEWGWQCLTPGCGYESTGWESVDQAETAGGEHMRQS